MAKWDDATIDWYAKTHGEDLTTRSVVEAAPFSAADAILDIGCGTGASLRHLAALGAEGRLVGVDPSERMICHARRLSPDRLEFAMASAEDLPFPDAAFDGVLAVNSVNHWPDPAAGFAEASRVLRPGGWIAAGGEVFDVTDGAVDVAEGLRLAGFVDIRDQDIAGGAVTMARKGRQ